MNFHFKTLGCKVNQYETQAMKEAVVKLGHTAENLLPADYVIINSCTVTAESDRKTRQMLHRVRNDNPGATIVLTGCMVQAFPEKAKELSDADIIIGNRSTVDVIKAIKNYNREKFFSVIPHEKIDEFTGYSISGFSERTRAFMKIEDGCNRYCSYCIIPKARGFVRSKSLADIKTEAQALAHNGYYEIVLVGINLSAFGLGTEFNLCDAVDAVCSVEGIKRVRLGSLEPDHVSDEMLFRLSKQEKFCPQFHLSLQSGCDRTLKRMNRHYDTSFFRDLVNRIRSCFDNAAITTDIMIGFPGETDDEFSESCVFVDEIGFARCHIFAYSRRKGTVADNMPDQISNSTKQTRAKIMSDIAGLSQKNFLVMQKDGVYPVLFEKLKSSHNEGYTPNYTRVIVDTSENLQGQIRNVKITTVFDDYAIGKLI